MSVTMNEAVLSEYQGKPVLNLNPQGRPSISFGLGKANVIRENIPAIIAFLLSEGKSIDVDPEIAQEIGLALEMIEHKLK